jgi:lambda family phage minor tail protein L
MPIQQDLQQLQPNSIVELFVLDCTTVGGDLLRFHNGKNALGANVVWQGNTYNAFPIEASGFEFNGKGQLPRPTLRVANVTSLLGALVRSYQDLVGCKLTRKRTLLKYLDAVNFPGATNPTADPSAAMPDDVYFIDRKSTENKLLIEFELAAAFDLSGVRLPRRFIVQNVCQWRYRGGECGYTGSAYFNINDQSVSSLSQDVCGKRLSSCKARFGQYAELPFGSFPAAGLVR